MIKEGAAIIDIGAQSTRPKADFISVEEELLRLIPVLKLIRKEHPLMPISIDTFHSKVAVEAIIEGASIINDISGGMMDDMMFETIAEYKVPYILMHIQGTPKTMQDNPTYENVVIEIMDYFVHKLHALKRLGVNDIIGRILRRIPHSFLQGIRLDHRHSPFRFRDRIRRRNPHRLSHEILLLAALFTHRFLHLPHLLFRMV